MMQTALTITGLACVTWGVGLLLRWILLTAITICGCIRFNLYCWRSQWGGTFTARSIARLVGGILWRWPARAVLNYSPTLLTGEWPIRRVSQDFVMWQPPWLLSGSWSALQTPRLRVHLKKTSSDIEPEDVGRT